MASMETGFTQLVGCTVPIQQAGMGGTATPDLAVAVADAGALGMIGLPMAQPKAMAEALESMAKRTSGAVGVNFLIPFLDRDVVASAAGQCRMVEFFYGDPDPSLVALAHEGDGLVSWQVGSVDEARAAVDAGCDIVVAQGVEAGGHVRGHIALLPLLDEVLGAVDVPVVAAGGIATPRTMAAVLAAGAAAARVGTRFVATEEADSHPSYLDALVAAEPEDTVLTTTFSAIWPDAPHRVLKSCVEAAQGIDEETVGEMEGPDGIRIPIPRCAPPTPGRHTTGRIEAMPHYAGQSVGAVRRVERAADVVRELAEGAEKLLSRRR
jgi:NAD(P)H-dependent flavin oxidoreductase YrpB (nitropropane dioxygenase family)